MEGRLHVTIPPWMYGVRVHFRLDIGAAIHWDMPDIVHRRATETHLMTLPSDAVWIWSDGSAEGGVSAGGSGALIVLPTGVEQELRARRRDAWCVGRVRTRGSTCCWSAPAWRALASASLEISGRTRRSCGTVGPWRPWAAATFTTMSPGLRSAVLTRGEQQQQ